MSTNAADILAQQFEQDGEAWKPAHVAVMACHQLGDSIAQGLRQYTAIRLEDETWSRRVQSGSAKFDAAIARQLRKKYEWWIQPCDKVLSCVHDFEEYGLIVDRADELRRAWSLVRAALRTPIEDVISSMQRVANGEYESL